MGKAATILVGSKRWRIRYGNPGRGLYGVCYPDEREVIIRPNLTVPESIGTAVHELLHAAYPDLEEEAIERGEYAITNGLRALGLIPTEKD